MGVAEVVDLLVRGGSTAALVLVVVGFLMGHVVPGYLFRRVQQERDELQAALLDALRTAHRATKLAEKRES